MSSMFTEFLLGMMRKDVHTQISGAGLDRMAMIKVEPELPEPEDDELPPINRKPKRRDDEEDGDD